MTEPDSNLALAAHTPASLTSPRVFPESSASRSFHPVFQLCHVFLKGYKRINARVGRRQVNRCVPSSLTCSCGSSRGGGSSGRMLWSQWIRARKNVSQERSCITIMILHFLSELRQNPLQVTPKAVNKDPLLRTLLLLPQHIYSSLPPSPTLLLSPGDPCVSRE